MDSGKCTFQQNWAGLNTVHHKKIFEALQLASAILTVPLHISLLTLCNAFFIDI